MKIAVLVSGGVDSSVALQLLKEQEHQIKAFYLKIWLEDELSFLGDCPWDEDLKYVREICENLDVPLEILPFQREYFERVVRYTIEEVEAGRTPNPDIMCNSLVKFGAFLDRLDSSFDKVATGHYAQIFEKEIKNSQGGQKIYFLKKAPDPIKDQTYFLARLNQDQLSKCLFPIGHLQKSEVRELAEKYNLPNKNRKDSQGICFLGKFKYNQFIEHYLGNKPGEIIEFETGKVLGEHDGFYYYTIGQRKGIKLPDGPWFVVDKNSKENKIYVSKKFHEEDKNRDQLVVEDLNWFQENLQNESKLDKNLTNLQVKLRHGEQIYNCQILENLETQKIRKTSKNPQHSKLPKTIKIKIDQRDSGIAPGQFAVFYQNDLCLGSGIISEGSH